MICYCNIPQVKTDICVIFVLLDSINCIYIIRMSTKMKNLYRLKKQDLDIPCRKMALYLLGKILVRQLDDGSILKGRIVETECYLGGEDKASISFGGRKTPGNEPMYMPSGTCYVYMTYGMYYCFNISSLEPGAAVLLRALEPIVGHQHMHEFRIAKRKKELKDIELCNGPSKLCMAFNIRKDNCNKLDLCESEYMWLETDPDFEDDSIKVVSSSRIGINSAGAEWAQKPLRFYILGNPHVSRTDKRAEKDLS